MPWKEIGVPKSFIYGALRKPRSGDIWLAWGVSPRYPTGISIRSPAGATGYFCSANCRNSWRRICRRSAAFFIFFLQYLGLTPQAKNLSRLRRLLNERRTVAISARGWVRRNSGRRAPFPLPGFDQELALVSGGLWKVVADPVPRHLALDAAVLPGRRPVLRVVEGAHHDRRPC